MRLTPEQLAAVRSRLPTTIVEACPGAGKTTVLAARIAHLIRERGAKPEQILALTFTRSACENIRTKVEADLGEAIAYRVQVQTFHAFAFSIIRARFPGLSVATETETEAAIRSLYKGPTRRPRMTPIRRLRRGIMAIEALGCVTEDQRVTSTINDITLVRNRLWDAGLIPTWNLVDGAQLCQGGVHQFNHVLIDELQDCTEAEWSLAWRASNGLDFFAVGDPRQAIMGWRGARDWHYEPTHRLTKSFRFGREIASVANEIAQRHGWPLIEAEPGEVMSAWASLTPKSILDQAGSRAVLCRTHRDCAEIAREIGPRAVHVQRRGDDALASDADLYEEIAAAGKIAVTTVHAAKGREWDAVAVCLPLDGDNEEARVNYVAVTRAKRALFLCGEPVL